jgi:hypothetical protein
MNAGAASTPASIFTSVPQPLNFTFGTEMAELAIGVAACRLSTTGTPAFPELGSIRPGADADADGESNARATLADALRSRILAPQGPVNFYEILKVPRGTADQLIIEAHVTELVAIPFVAEYMERYARADA